MCCSCQGDQDYKQGCFLPQLRPGPCTWPLGALLPSKSSIHMLTLGSLLFCEMPNFQFPPLVAIPQCPWPTQQQALSTRSTKLPLRQSQEQGRGEPQLRELSPHHSDWPYSSLVHRGSPCQGVCTARNSQGPCAWQVERENKSWGGGIGRKHNLQRTVF